MYDYNSFYPWAMANLPPITKGEWQKVNRFVNDLEGFYQLSGKVAECSYSVIIKSPSEFSYANGEYVRDISVPSYELREALRLNEIEVDEITGWVWVPKEDASNPFDDYIHHFYKLKNESRDKEKKYSEP